MLAPVEAVVGRMARKASFTRCMEQVGGWVCWGSQVLLCALGMCLACFNVPVPPSTCQGIGRHSDGDRLALVGEELGALAAALGDRPFLFGDRRVPAGGPAEEGC